MLGRKQNSSNEDWVKTFNNIEKIVSKQHIDELTEKTVHRLKDVIIKKGYTRIGYAWSGGKDSIVMYDLIRKSGVLVVGGVLALYEHEFPAFVEWIEKNKPSDCTVMKTGAFTDEFLNENPDYLFPMETKYKDAYLPPRWKVQNAYASKHKLECILMGRRTMDGNNCGKKENHNITSSKGCDKFNFMADWTHEDVLAYIKYNNLELPPIYFYENGFQGGTQLWTEKRRINGYIFDTLELLESIDKRIIEQSIGKLNVVDEYLEYKKGKGIKK